jgi:WD40 repeat protein
MGSYTAMPDGVEDFGGYGSTEEVMEDIPAILRDESASVYAGAGAGSASAQRQQTAVGAQVRTSTQSKSLSKQSRDREREREREREAAQLDSDLPDLANMSISGMNIDTMRISTALGGQLGTPAMGGSSRTGTQGMRNSGSRRALDSAAGTPSGSSRHNSSRQPLRTANRVHREKEREAEKDGDPLDMSCDSLDRLQVTGTAATASNNARLGETAKIGERDGTAKISGSTRQSRRGASATASASGSRRHEESGGYLGGGSTNPNLSASVDDDRDGQASGMFSSSPQALDEHTAAVTRLRAPERTNLLVSSSLDGTIRIWGPESSSDGGSRAVLEATGFKTDNTYSAFADQRPERRVSLGTGGAPNGGDDSSLTGSVTTARGPTVKITNMWVDEACETIWATCSDTALRVWSGGEGRPLRLLKGHEDQITAMEGMDTGSSSASHLLQSSVSGNPSSCLVATGSADRTVRVWDVRAKKAQVFSFRGHGDTVLVLRWGEGGRSLVSGGKDKSVRIWDTRAGR